MVIDNYCMAQELLMTRNKFSQYKLFVSGVFAGEHYCQNSFLENNLRLKEQ